MPNPNQPPEWYRKKILEDAKNFFEDNPLPVTALVSRSDNTYLIDINKTDFEATIDSIRNELNNE